MLKYVAIYAKYRTLTKKIAPSLKKWGNYPHKIQAKYLFAEKIFWWCELFNIIAAPKYLDV